MGWKILPIWLKGLIICFIIFFIATLVINFSIENINKTVTGPNLNGVIGYGIILLGTYALVILILLISIILSFIQYKNYKTPQFKMSYIFFLIIIILLVFLIFFSLKYLFPVTYKTNVKACLSYADNGLQSDCIRKVICLNYLRINNNQNIEEWRECENLVQIEDLNSSCLIRSVDKKTTCNCLLTIINENEKKRGDENLYTSIKNSCLNIS